MPFTPTPPAYSRYCLHCLASDPDVRCAPYFPPAPQAPPPTLPPSGLPSPTFPTTDLPSPPSPGSPYDPMSVSGVQPPLPSQGGPPPASPPPPGEDLAAVERLLGTPAGEAQVRARLRSVQGGQGGVSNDNRQPSPGRSPSRGRRASSPHGSRSRRRARSPSPRRYHRAPRARPSKSPNRRPSHRRRGRRQSSSSSSSDSSSPSSASSSSGGPPPPRRRRHHSRGRSGGLPDFTHGAVIYAPPRSRRERLPPSFTSCALHDKAVQSYLFTVGNVKPWDERTDKPEHAMQWLDSVLHMASVSRVDFGRLIRSRLSLRGQQWLSALLPQHTYDHWVRHDYAAFKEAFRLHFAHQTRPDHDLAADLLFERGLRMGDMSLDSYVEQFMHLSRRLRPGTLSHEAHCKFFLKGLHPDLKAQCLVPPKGEFWTDLSSLISFARREYRILRVSHAQEPGRGHPRRSNGPSSAAALHQPGSPRRPGRSRGRGRNRGTRNKRGRPSCPSPSPDGLPPPPSLAFADAGRHPSGDQRRPQPSRWIGTGLNKSNSDPPESRRQRRRLTEAEAAEGRRLGLCLCCRGTFNGGRHLPKDCPGRLLPQYMLQDPSRRPPSGRNDHEAGPSSRAPK